MKYMYSTYTSIEGTFSNITITEDDVNFSNITPVVGNPNYDQFLVQVELTDKQVHTLTPDVWYNFPEGI